MTTQITITRRGNVEKSLGTVAFADIKATDNAEPTSRVLDGSYDHGFAEEWSEPSLLPDGRKASTIYLFAQSDITDNDGAPRDAENYPWDADHCARAIIED